MADTDSKNKGFYDKLSDLYKKYNMTPPAFTPEEEKAPADRTVTPSVPKSSEILTPSEPLPRREIEQGAIPKGMGTSVGAEDAGAEPEEKAYARERKGQGVESLSEYKEQLKYPETKVGYPDNLQGTLQHLYDIGYRTSVAGNGMSEETRGKAAAEASKLRQTAKERVAEMGSADELQRLMNSFDVLWGSLYPAGGEGAPDPMRQVGLDVSEILQDRLNELVSLVMERDQKASPEPSEEAALEAERAKGTRNIGEAPQQESSAETGSGEGLTPTSSIHVHASEMWRHHVSGKDKLKGLWEVISGKLRRKRIDNAVATGHASKFKNGDAVLLALGPSLMPGSVVQATSNSTYNVLCAGKLYSGVEEQQLTDMPNNGLFK